jgi:hypothetical protein
MHAQNPNNKHSLYLPPEQALVCSPALSNACDSPASLNLLRVGER